ncbi:MAG: glycoside hydrolase family 2 [Capsulimonas sp.]|nr:glycoside hydrolase family 2 [Capsulimonas sp.]
MKRSHFAPAFALMLVAGCAHAQDGWKPAHSTIETRWAKDVSPTNALPDYPRPQLVRDQWQNLNGVWEYQPGAEGDALPVGKTLSQKILVPYAVESALSGVMEHHDRLWYRRTFTTPASWKGKELILHFDAVDYEAEIFVNGKSVGVHKGGYEAFDYDVTSFLQGDGPQELIVRVFDPTEAGGQPRGKQTTNPGGIMYTPTTGIWQTVWLEPVAKTSIANLKIVPDVDASSVHLTVNTTDTAPGVKAVVTIKSGKSTVKTVTIDADKEQTIAISKPKLWSPDSPFLYDLDVKLVQGGATTDQVGSYFGMRKISLGLDKGVQKMLLNNKFVFEIGPLDQGFWPESLYTPPTEEAMKADISTMKQLGFNMVRKHIKVEPARWYYWTDKMGLLVWQDMPSPNSYIGNAPPTDHAAFEKQINHVITTHWNSPSIIMWVIFNESQARYDTARLVGMAKTLDPSRLVNRDSGAGYETDGDTAVGDVDDVHSYPPPGVSGPSATQALACGEYGGIGFLVKGHRWKTTDGWGYTTVPDPKELEDTYGEYANMLKGFRDKNGLSAAVYTQITDVEIESNGLMTYDRILKCDPKQIALANHFEYPVPVYKEIVPTSEKSAQTWKYTTDQPAAEWSAKAFNDADWKQGPGGFGHSVASGNPLGTPWETSDIWLRRTFTLPKLSADDLKQLLIRDCHDEDIEVFINGVPAYSHDGYIGNYENRPISAQAIAALVLNGENTLAVHCKQTTGGQFIDVGLTQRVPGKK